MKTARRFYRQFEQGAYLECTCVGISANKWDKLMKNAKRADRRIVIRAAIKAGIISKEEGLRELKQPYYNPYNHYRTNEHLVYVHSRIEHFLRSSKK